MGISRARRMVAPLGAIAALLTAATAFAGSSAPPGSVHQASSKNGCYTSNGSSETGPGTCNDIRGGGGSTTLAISPDGHFAYLVGYGNSASGIPPVLSVFQRNSNNGTLKQLPGKSGCFSRDGSSEDGANTCTKARDLDTGDATSIAISNDGRFLYVASQYEPGKKPIGGIAVFKRNVKTGTLRQLKGKAGCVSANGASQDGPNTCARARAVDFVSNLHITPDQKFLYASDYGNPPKTGIAVFARAAQSGTLHQLKGMNGCITGNGTTLRSGTKRVCRSWPNVSDPWDVATPNNRFAYIPAATNGGAGVDLVQAFERNARGGLMPLKGKGGCVSDTGTSLAGPCVRGRGLLRPERAVLSKNNRFLYVNSYGNGSVSPVAVLNRNPKTGTLSQRFGKSACISADGTSGDGSTCRTGRALQDGYAGALAPNGRTLYYSENGTASGGGGLAIFRVSPTTGAFSQLSGKFGCVTGDGSSEKGPGTCQKGRAVAGAYQVAIGRSGRTVYVSSYSDNGVALFYAMP